MIKWCSSFWKQRKTRLADCIWILSVIRNAATFQKERIAWGQMAFRWERRSLRLPEPRAQPSAAALLTPINPFCHYIILNLKWYYSISIPGRFGPGSKKRAPRPMRSEPSSSSPASPYRPLRDLPLKRAEAPKGMCGMIAFHW